MASYNAGGGNRSGRKRGSGRERGRRNFPDQEMSDIPKYPLRNTQSRRSGFQDCFDEPNPVHESGEYSRRKGPTSTSKQSPKSGYKNTHVVYFWRTESPYSQFHPATFSIEDTKYSCAEQFMMSSKARIFDDPKSLASIMNTKVPAVMKKLGRGVENFDPDIWKMCCRQFVQEGNIAKFSQSAILLEELLSTGDRYLAEASPMDKIWGIGMAENNPLAKNPNNWKGTNWLGEAVNLVKFEFQTMICLICNKDSIKGVTAKRLLDLFQVGTRDYFDKMKCDILITDEEDTSYTLAGKRSSKSSNKKKKITKPDEVGEVLAPNFDVQPPGKDGTEAGEKVKEHESDTEEKILGEKLKSSEGTEFPKNSDQEQTPKHDRRTAAEKKSPLLKRKTSPNAEEAQSSKEKTKLKKITFCPKPENIPDSIKTAVEHILTDWVRLKFLRDMPLLKCFMDLETDELEKLTGTCTYQTDIQVITPGITICSVLTNVRKEFNRLEHIFAGQTSFIKDLDCATTPPVFPTSKPNPKERSISSWFSEKSKSSPQKVQSSKKLDKSVNEATKTEPDSIAAGNTEIIPSVQETPTQEDANVISPNKLIEGDDSVTHTETTPMDQGESLEELAKNTDIPPTPEEPTTENTGLLPVVPDKPVTENDKPTAEDTAVVSKKETTNKDVIPTSSPDDPSGEKREKKKKSKDKKKSTEDDEEADSAKMQLGKPEAGDTEIVSKEITKMDVTPTSSSDDPNGEKERRRKSKKKKKSTEDDEEADSAKMQLGKPEAGDTEIVSKETTKMDVTPTSSSDDPNGEKERRRKSKDKKKSTEDDEEADSAKMQLGKPEAGDTEIVSKETTKMDVTPTSSSDDPNGEKERRRKSKKKKKSTEDDEETDSAKRHKNNSEGATKLVPYASSSHSDQDSPEGSGENKNPPNREKAHSSNEPSPDTKSANSSEINLKATLDQSNDEKDKPVDTETTMDTEEKRGTN